MTFKSKWAHLPNAVHIDQVIASLKSHPGQWGAVTLARDAAWQARRKAVWYEVQEAALKAVQNEVQYAAWDALLCLIAYDDCGYMFDSDVGELKILAALGDLRAILMLPACIAFNAIKKLQNVN